MPSTTSVRYLTPEFSCGTLPHQAQNSQLVGEADQPLIMMLRRYRLLQRTLDSELAMIVIRLLQRKEGATFHRPTESVHTIPISTVEVQLRSLLSVA